MLKKIFWIEIPINFNICFSNFFAFQNFSGIDLHR
jgi:hypothetical protein